jgi:ATP-dependent DNA helicase RecG
MTAEEFDEKLNEIQKMKCESQTLELKSAGMGCPKRLYDTLSSFSN